MDPIEEGEILQNEQAAIGQYYDPAYAWPGDDGNSSSETFPSSEPQAKPRSGQRTFRFVVIRSGVLPANQKVAVVDAYAEVQIGRDVQPEGSATPRIRLKEMEVSKIHATAYWDDARKEWNVVDMGSKHGTFLRLGPISLDSTDSGMRLSQPRAASIPQRLRHSDHLTVGSTTFAVHIHEDGRPCGECTVSGPKGSEVPLFPPAKKGSMKRTRADAGMDSYISTPNLSASGRDPKKALTILKHSLLTRHSVPKFDSASEFTVPVEKPNDYIDRAARRRLLRPASRPDTPGVSAPSPKTSCNTEFATQMPEEESLQSVVSQPPAPLPSSNIGHRLLLQQGWAPGNALGMLPDTSEDRIGLVDPLEIKFTQNRAGLGMQRPTTHNWKEREKLKRFGDLR
jgi:pSer/pThr/pTyr-binding forkhead associated (FHA) protein